MLLVAILGDRGSGKTTFLGLLYATLVRVGSDREDELRFHAAYESLDEVTALFQRLMSGGFPDAATKEGIRELRLLLGYHRSTRGLLPRIGSRKRGVGAASALRITLPGSLAEAAEGFQEGGTFGTGRWRDALDADVALLLVDSAKLATKKGEEPETRPMTAYDGQVDALFAAIRRWRSRGGREVLHPIFVLSKFDAISPDVLEGANLEATPPDVSETHGRAAYAKALLEPNLPRTMATLQRSGKGRPRFAPPAFVFSSVRTETRALGQHERVKLRRTQSGGWEPDYSREEYVALLELLAGIAADTTG